MSNLPPGAPDYFALFQSMFTPGGTTATAPQAEAPPMFAMLDPKELERKIGELEIVLAWLKGTTGMIELSLQTMKYQQSLLATFAGNDTKKSPQTPAANLEEFTKMAESMNPATWALNMMAQPAAKKTPKKKATRAPRVEKKARR